MITGALKPQIILSEKWMSKPPQNGFAENFSNSTLHFFFAAIKALLELAIFRNSEQRKILTCRHCLAEKFLRKCIIVTP